MLTRRANQSGITLIELIIGLALFAMLAAMAAPRFAQMTTDQRVRSRAESIKSGLQTARQEALRMNRSVTFALVADMPENGVDTDLAPLVNPAGPHWVVAQVPGGDPMTVFTSQVEREGGGERPPIVGVLPATPAAATVVFTPLGATTLTAPSQFTIYGPDGLSSCQPTGRDFCMNVEVSPSGQITLCDPKVTTAGHTHKCPSTPTS